MKLELGSGLRPTEGYLHQDCIQLEVSLDYVCKAWEVPIYEGSLDEVIAIAVIEHLRYTEVTRTLSHIHRLLKPGGIFLFDVPDVTVWIRYLHQIYEGIDVPYSKEDVIKTLWGHQRWEGDEHKSMWDYEMISAEVKKAGFLMLDGLEDIKQRVHRDRFYHPENAHIFIKAIK
jgi:predicted SAM-dependent methyltransferase